MTTTTTGLRTRIPAVDADNLLALLFSNPLQDLQELSECQITDLAPPKSLHSLKVQCFKAQHVKLIYQFMGKFPKPIRATVSYVFMFADEMLSSLLSISRTLLFTRQFPRGFCDFIDRLLQELGRFNLGAIRASEESFQTKIKASDSTRLDFNYQLRTINDHNHKKLSQRSSFNGHSLNRSLNLSTVPILVDSTPNFDTVATQEFIACLLQRERFIFSDFFKVGRPNSFFVVLEEQLVRLLNPLANVLYSLRTNRLPELITLANLGDMSLKFGAVQMLFEHPIVPFMQRNCVVIDHPSSIDLQLQVSISIVLIKFELQCFHATIIQHFSVQNHEEKIGFQERRIGARSP